MEIGDRLPEIDVRTADGARVPLSRYLGRPTAVMLLRYYG